MTPNDEIPAAVAHITECAGVTRDEVVDRLQSLSRGLPQVIRKLQGFDTDNAEATVAENAATVKDLLFEVELIVLTMSNTVSNLDRHQRSCMQSWDDKIARMVARL